MTTNSTLEARVARLEDRVDRLTETLVTKQDLDSAVGLMKQDLDSAVGLLKQDLDSSVSLLKRDLDSSAGMLKRDLDSSASMLKQDIDNAVRILREDSKVLHDRLNMLTVIIVVGFIFGVGTALLTNFMG